MHDVHDIITIYHSSERMMNSPISNLYKVYDQSMKFSSDYIVIVM